jgi:hypothetical protein
MNTTTIEVRVTELLVGDIILPTMRTVTHAPYYSIDCPKKKINVDIDGYRKTWGKSTIIKIKRAI